jgi:hypothetical protein
VLYCAIHQRAFLNALQRWLPVNPVYIAGLPHLLILHQGCCDTCVAEAKAALPALCLSPVQSPCVAVTD